MEAPWKLYLNLCVSLFWMQPCEKESYTKAYFMWHNLSSFFFLLLLLSTVNLMSIGFWFSFWIGLDSEHFSEVYSDIQDENVRNISVFFTLIFHMMVMDVCNDFMRLLDKYSFTCFIQSIYTQLWCQVQATYKVWGWE